MTGVHGYVKKLVQCVNDSEVYIDSRHAIDFRVYLLPDSRLTILEKGYKLTEVTSACSIACCHILSVGIACFRRVATMLSICCTVVTQPRKQV